ncbi:MAG: GntR family transcriptional regulator [Pseudohongiellaceae bacterium]|jgi:GntR family transcriptional regulator
MLLTIAPHSNATLQEQILTQIRARILAGELQADAGLPSIRALASQLKVSVITVQRAYDALLNEGLIYARRGKGYFVAALPEADKSALAQERFASRLRALLEQAQKDGLDHATVATIFRKMTQPGD